MSELGPVSQAILDYIQARTGYVGWFRMINSVERRTGEKHTGNWYFRRVMALALEGRIDFTMHRTGDDVAISFRRLHEAEAKVVT